MDKFFTTNKTQENRTIYTYKKKYASCTHVITRYNYILQNIKQCHLA